MAYYVCFYTTRRSTGTPEQQWSPDVYLTDHWLIHEDRAEAIKTYNKLVVKDEVHSAGIAPIDAEYRTDWFEQ
tara:strand:- start:498 stop:716 length:219 start_codon:yes stop_codon:yes gene_type:complete